MKKLIGILSMIVLFTGFQVELLGQDPIFSQFYNSHLQLNPALCGNTHSALIQVNYRNQWPSLPNAYSTYSISVDKYFDDLKSGFGLQLVTDNAGQGAMKNTGGSLFYSYRLKIQGNTYIKGGMEVGFNQLSLDWSKLTFGDAIDARNGPISPGGTPYPSAEINNGNNSNSYVTVGAGLTIFNPKYYIGIALKHMNQPEISFLNVRNSALGGTKLPMRFSIQAGNQITLKKGNKNVNATFISPNIIFQNQSGFSQVNAGAYLNVDKIQGGLWYRHTVYNGDALIFSAGVKYDFLKITYSYDYTTSKLGINQGGSHEIGLVFNFDHIYKPKQDYNDCFQIFR